MNKKLLALAIGLSVSAMGAAQAYVESDNVVLSPYEHGAEKIMQESIAQELSTSVRAPREVTLGLDETIQLALSKDYTLRSTQEKFKEASSKVSLAGAAKNPKINVGYKASRSGGHVKVRVPNPKNPTETIEQTITQPPVTNQRGTALTLTVPIYTGGLAEGSLEMARFGREIARADVKAVAEETKLNAAKSYYNVLRAQNMAYVSDMAVKDLAGHLRVVNLSYKVGVVAKSDVLATEVMMAEMKSNQIKAHNAVALSQAALNRALALPMGTAIKIKDTSFQYKPYDITLGEATAYALMHRPELYKSALAVQVAKQQIRVAQAGYKPKIQFSASKNWGHQSPAPAGQPAVSAEEAKALKAAGHPVPMIEPTGSASNWSVSIGASWDLWDGGTTAANVKAAKAAYESQKKVHSNAVSGITLDVQQAYYKMKEAEAIIQSTKSSVEQGEESLRIASLRYGAGVGTNLDVLDAELNLDKARNNYIDALYNYNINVATLEKAMGTPVYLPIGQGLVIAQESKSEESLNHMIQDVLATEKK